MKADLFTKKLFFKYDIITLPDHITFLPLVWDRACGLKWSLKTDNPSAELGKKILKGAAILLIMWPLIIVQWKFVVIWSQPIKIVY